MLIDLFILADRQSLQIGVSKDSHVSVAALKAETDTA